MKSSRQFLIIEKIKPKSYDVKTSKMPKNKIKIKNQKIQGFKSIEIKQYIYIYIYIILRNREIQ